MKTNKIIFAFLMLLFAGIANAQMVLEYTIDAPNTTIQLPLNGTINGTVMGTVNVQVDWADGSPLEPFTTYGDKPHIYNSPGIKIVTITGELTGYGNLSNTSGNARLTKVLSWEGLGLVSLSYAFKNATLLTEVPASLPTTVINLSGIFSGAWAFNQPIGGWNTTAVTNMEWMFLDAKSFNQPIGSWNTSSVTNMNGMFWAARAFNQPVGNWNTAAVTNMITLFFHASAFNQPIGNWNTGAVTEMTYMFSGASAFNQSLGSWNITKVTSMAAMFQDVGLCTDNYNATLTGWSSQAVKSGVSFDGGISKYSGLGASARAALVGKGWSITDAGSGITAGAKCMLNQTITFAPIPEKEIADASFNLTATASSGLNVTYTSSNTAVATVSGNVVTIVGAGVTTITALQAGNTSYNAAANVVQTLIVQAKVLLSYNIIRGKIYTDANTDCIHQGTELGLSSMVVKAMPGSYYSYTDEDGNYEVRVDTGTVSYTLTQQYNVLNTATLINQCATSHLVVLTGASKDTASFDFANEVKACTMPSVNLSHAPLVRCFKSNAHIQYCNLGNATITNAVVKVEYPAHLIPISSVPMWTSKTGSTLFFDIGTLQETTCGQINIIDSVVCSSPSIVGLTQCIKVSMTPNTTCTTQSVLWDLSSTEVVGSCNNDQVEFVLTNTGDGHMADSLAYRIFVNDTLIFNGKYKLLSGAELTVRYPAQAQTVRLEADQHTNHPGQSHPQATIERCGFTATGFVPTGLVTTTAQDDLDEAVDIACATIIGSYDPNDKQASPSGVGLTNQVGPGTEIEYTIRFQNTGTAPAQTVKIIDTLDANVDVASFIEGVSSHPYTLTLTGKGQAVLTFTFSNINLPDSTADNAGSNGLVTFNITIPSDVALGTVIHNKAYIYFDFNEPIITNTTTHTVGITIAEDLSKGQNVQVGNLTTGLLHSKYTSVVKIYPNPSDGLVTVELGEVGNNMELRVTSIVGVPQKTIKLTSTTKQEVNLAGVLQGMYLYEIWQDGERRSVGKLQVK